MNDKTKTKAQLIADLEVLRQQVTKLEQSKATLQKSNERLEEVQQLAQIGSWEWNLKQQTLIWSDEVYRIFGVIPGAFKPSVEAFEATIHPQDREDFLRQRTQMLDEKQLAIIDHRIILPDAEVRYVQERTQVILNPQEQVSRIIGTVQDITERKQMEEILRESEEKFRSLAENSQDYIMRYDKECRHLYENPAALKISGLTEVDIIRKTHREAGFDEGLSNLWEERITQVFKTGQSSQTIFEWESAEGIIYLDWRLFPEFDAHGNINTVLGVSRDITERKQTQEALRESEELHRIILSNISDAIFITDDKGMFTYICPNVATIWGYSYDEIQTFGNISQLLGEDFFNPSELAASHEIKNIGRDIRSKSGQEHSLLINVKQVSIYSGTVLYTCHDITKRKQAEEKLASERNLLRTILDAALDFIYVKDTEGCFIMINSAHLRSLGKSSTEVIGKHNTEVYPSEIAAQFSADEKAIIETGQALVDKDETRLNQMGEPIWLRTTKVPLQDENKEIVGIVGISRNITERKQAEKALLSSKERFERAITQAPIPMVITDANQDIVLYNDKFIEEFGYTLEDVSTAEEWWCAAYPDEAYRQQVQSSWEKAIAKARETNTEIEMQEWNLVIKDRSVRRVEFKMMPLGDTSLISMTNITERKQMEEQRENLLTELSNKNAELERFTYTVSHDLKSPIITIKGFLGYLEKDVLEGNIEAMKNDITFIADAADKMNQLLGELLELSRIGRIINPPEQIPLEIIVKEALDLVSNVNERDFSLEIMPNLPTIYVDRIRMLQVFENLISNAIKFSKHKSDARIEIGFREDNSETIIYVQDNGAGIDPKYHETIFGLFDQLDQTIEGTGVGLAIVKRIIEAHNGRIWIESEGNNQGCTFCFTIPNSSADNTQS